VQVLNHARVALLVWKISFQALQDFGDVFACEKLLTEKLCGGKPRAG
jgi:hypothetical protein